jgi:hypothetical protein
MLHHVFLCSGFVLGLLTGGFGRKFYAAVVEARFFQPDLYGHLPAVSFVD